MRYDTILYDLDAGIATITLNRPEKMNALTPQMRAELTDALKRAAGEARVIVLTGAGQAFCSGQDLGEGMTAAAVDLERVLRDEYAPIIRWITEAPVPVIAAVNGPAAGAGANIALMADIVIATRSAYFLQAFGRIGLMPDAGGTYTLPRTVGDGDPRRNDLRNGARNERRGCPLRQLLRSAAHHRHYLGRVARDACRSGWRGHTWRRR